MKDFYTRITLIALFITINACASTSQAKDNNDRPNFKTQVRTALKAESQEQFIRNVAIYAHERNSDALMNLIWPTTKKAFGESGWKAYLDEKIFPYFKDFNNIDTYEGIAALDDFRGSMAVVHFGYYQDSTGNRHPYEMIIVEDNGKRYLGNIIIGRCVKGHHPICD